MASVVLEVIANNLFQKLFAEGRLWRHLAIVCIWTAILTDGRRHTAIRRRRSGAGLPGRMVGFGKYVRGGSGHERPSETGTACRRRHGARGRGNLADARASRSDRKRMRMDFLVHTDQPCAYDEEILDSGSQILRCTAPPRSAALRTGYGRCICRVLRRNPQPRASLQRIPSLAGSAGRSCRPHRAQPFRYFAAGCTRSWMRSAYLRVAKQWIQANATHLVGASRVAGRALFGANGIRMSESGFSTAESTSSRSAALRTGA